MNNNKPKSDKTKQNKAGKIFYKLSRDQLKLLKLVENIHHKTTPYFYGGYGSSGGAAGSIPDV